MPSQRKEITGIARQANRVVRPVSMSEQVAIPFVEALKQQCMWCDNIALYECDAVIGMAADLAPGYGRDKGPRIVYAALERQEVWTCDAPMCALHRRVRGFYCGKEPGTIDRCPYCARHEPEGGPMLKEDADRIRRERHAQIRRSQLRVSDNGSEKQ